MSEIARAWVFHGDAQPLLDKAIHQCTQDHRGRLPGSPSVVRATGQRKDGSTFPFTLVLVEDDAEGWWAEYAQVHGWLSVSKDGIDKLYGTGEQADDGIAGSPPVRG